jgi:hypothetical protein
MESAQFHVFGVGGEYLRYIGWTTRPLSEESDIFLDLIKHDHGEVPGWLERRIPADEREIFEIESAPTIEQARQSVEFWGQYYRLIGANVIADAS